VLRGTTHQGHKAMWHEVWHEPGLKEAALGCPLPPTHRDGLGHMVHVLCTGPCVPVLCMTYTHTCICCTITGFKCVHLST
jgi:hypothetical protein